MAPGERGSEVEAAALVHIPVAELTPQEPIEPKGVWKNNAWWKARLLQRWPAVSKAHIKPKEADAQPQESPQLLGLWLGSAPTTG